MALVKCPECGKDISNQASSCPNCGHPLNTKEATEKSTEKKEKKKDSTLSIVACVIAGVALLIPMPMIISFVLAVAAVITGGVDLGIGKKDQRHLGSWFAVIVGIIYACVVWIL